MLVNLTTFKPTSNINTFKKTEKLSYNTDCVSFSGKKSINSIANQMINLDKSAFPSENLRLFMISELSKPENTSSIIDLHSQYYFELQNCKTLDEAKELYPEFSGVIDAKSLDIEGLNKKNMLKRVANNEFEGLSIDNLSIELLKRYYKPLPVSRGNIDEYFNFDTTTTRKLLDTLNIKMDKAYSSLLGRQFTLNASFSADTIEKRAHSLKEKYSSNPELKKHIGEISRERWQQEGYRERVAETTSSEEFKKRASEASKRLWQNEDYRIKTTQKRNEVIRTPEQRKKRQEIWQRLSSDPDFVSRFQAAHRTPEFREKLSQITTARWQDPSAREVMVEAMNSEDCKILSLICSIASKIAWEKHPEAKTCYRKISKRYPYMRQILKKERMNKPLTQEQERYKMQYFSECSKEFPSLRKEVTAIQKELLENWGFYEKDRNPIEILAIAEYEYESLFR